MTGVPSVFIAAQASVGSATPMRIILAFGQIGRAGDRLSTRSGQQILGTKDYLQVTSVI